MMRGGTPHSDQLLETPSGRSLSVVVAPSSARFGAPGTRDILTTLLARIPMRHGYPPSNGPGGSLNEAVVREAGDNPRIARNPAGAAGVEPSINRKPSQRL